MCQESRNKTTFPPLPSSSLYLFFLKKIIFKIFFNFLFFISHQHFFIIFLNKKLTPIQFFFTFSYKLFQFYITSILFLIIKKKKKTKGRGG
jgi:hypothetical protein